MNFSEEDSGKYVGLVVPPFVFSRILPVGDGVYLKCLSLQFLPIVFVCGLVSQHLFFHARPIGVKNSAGMVKRSYPTSEVRGGSREELPNA